MELLEKHFELAVETPDGIKKLRELILTLAMKGKLVPQDPNDQPASELLKEIELKRRSLLKSKVLKSGQIIKNQRFISELVIPSSWRWVKAEEIFFITKLAGFEYTKYIKLYDYGEVPVIRAQNVRPLFLELKNIKYIDLKTSELLYRSCLSKNCLLVTFIGAGIGDVALFDRSERWHLAPNVAKMEPFENCDALINLKFINYYLLSSYGKKEIFKHFKSTAQPSISMGTIRDIDCPIPPQNEQIKIVSKIDHLMSLCDKLEAERNERNTKRIKVNTSAINKLLKAPDKKTFHHSWIFIEKNFDELYSVPENVEELKKAILQLAVMGKLVPQDSNDQPASELLKEIEAEKKRLIKEGKIKKQPDLAPIRQEDIPYELPKGWEWVRLGKITDSISDGVHYAPTYISKGIPCISAKDIYNDSINLNSCNYVTKQEYISQKDKFLLRRNSLLVTKSGSIGRTAIYDGNFDLYLVESVGVINLPENNINPRYIKYLLNLIFTSITYDGDYVRGLGVKHLTLTLISSILVPLPSYHEQIRIVSKIDQLIKFCNKLEKDIINLKTKQLTLINSIL